MGIRVGAIIVRTSWESVRPVLAARYGPIGDCLMKLAGDRAWGLNQNCLLTTQGDGLCVAMDPKGIMAADADLAGVIAKATGSLSVTLLTESISETHQLVVADATGLRRAFYRCGHDGTGPVYLGRPLAGETSVALDDGTTGEDLLALLAAEGLGIDWVFQAMWDVFPTQRLKSPAPGPTARALRAAIDEAVEALEPDSPEAAPTEQTVRSPGSASPAQPRAGADSTLGRLWRRILGH